MVGRGGVLVLVIVNFHVPVGLMAGSPALVVKPVTARNNNAIVKKMRCCRFIGFYIVIAQA